MLCTKETRIYEPDVKIMQERRWWEDQFGYKALHWSRSLINNNKI